ncbi:SHOCT domain-containing protein [Streptomyces sp. NPDC003697]
MQTLAHWDGGPGPWILLFPLIWAAVLVGAATVLRRTGRRGRGGPWHAPQAAPRGDAPLAVLGRRFASGEMDEEEYWRRLSVLEEHFGRSAPGNPT